MNHLQQNPMDIENNMLKGSPDDFILPKDDDDGQLWRQQEADNRRLELERITRELDKFLKLTMCKRQAE